MHANKTENVNPSSHGGLSGREKGSQVSQPNRLRPKPGAGTFLMPSSNATSQVEGSGIKQNFKRFTKCDCLNYSLKKINAAWIHRLFPTRP